MVYFCAAVLGLCALILVIYFRKIWEEYTGQTPGHPPRFGDFLALWSYAKIAGTHSATELYDFANLHARQVALGMDAAQQNPFPYPPPFIFILRPLGLLPLEAAYVIWLAGTFALFIWALCATCSRLPVCTLGAIVAPVSIATISSGQSGFLSAALMIAGLRLAATRPVLSGIFLGILACKPQLCLLVPFALTSGGLWPTLRVAATTAIGLAVAATITLGWSIWPAWLSMLPTYAQMFDRETVGLKFMPTVVANLELLGLTLSTAKFVQGIAATAAALVVFLAFRRGPTSLAVATLLVATFVATPHAFIYDMPMVIGALALFIQARVEEQANFNLAERLILLAAYLFPIPMLMEGVRLPVSIVPLLLLLGLIMREQRLFEPAVGWLWLKRAAT